MSLPELPFSDPIRINQIGAGVSRELTPDADALKRIARALDLQSISDFTALLKLEPARVGWTLSGRVKAEVVQTCGLTLEPLPASINRTFSIDMIEAPETPEEEAEVEVAIDDDSPDLIEDGRIDLGQYAVEQLALDLDPFPRKAGAVFVQPEEPAEISPFAALKSLKSQAGDS